MRAGLPAGDARPAHLHVRVDGRVQGVGYRAFVRAAAVRVGVVGWVANLTDGGVEIVGWGAEGMIELLRAALAQGPPGAAVHRVTALANVGSCPPAEFLVVRCPPGGTSTLRS